MPSLPDIPGKGRVTGTGHRAGKLAVGAGLAVIAIGGYAARRLLRKGGGDERPASADTISEPPGRAEPLATTGTDAPPKPAAEPGDISKDRDPHHALNNPVGEPDPTEWPDPYERREDPRDPSGPEAQPLGETHSPTNAESTSEPHPADDPEAGDRAEPPKRDKLDD